MNLPVDIRQKVKRIHDLYFSQICHFRPMTKPTENDNFGPITDPTQPNPRVNRAGLRKVRTCATEQEPLHICVSKNYDVKVAYY